jgi:outer membrane lipoprotein-sorting protein
MNLHEKIVSDFIDQLNIEKKPKEDEYTTDSDELKELFQTVKLVKSLKEPAMPGEDFPVRLVKAVEEQVSRKHTVKSRKWAWMASVVGIAAMFALMMNILFTPGSSNIVKAMEEAYQMINAYHGTIEIVETNKDGESVTQAKLEVWANKDGNYYIKGLQGPNKNYITVNNGEKKWQLQPDKKQVQIFPTFPDNYSFIFDLGNEINDVKNALSVKEIGEEKIVGRKTTVLEITPKGGSSYHLWIDQETKLPLKKQSAMQHAIQYTVTYTQIDFSNPIPNELLSYQVPRDYTVIDNNPEQVVNNLEEAQKTVGFTPTAPKTIPDGYIQERIAVLPEQKVVKMYYSTKDRSKKVMIVQGKSTGKFEPVPNATLGKINKHPVEIQAPLYEEAGLLGGGIPYSGTTKINSLRWQQDGLEFAVVGQASLEDLTVFVENVVDGKLEMPSQDEQSSFKPKVEVPYDLSVEENDQKNADAGSSPWKLDPLFTTQVFVSLKMSPEGITGEYPVSIEDLKLVQNTGKTAIVEVTGDQSPIKRIYLKRLIRQDATGIWTVVGYDPME